VNVLTLCRSQSASLGLASAVFVAAGLAFAARTHFSPRYSEIAYYALFFAAVLPVWALAASLGQVLVLRHKMRSYSAILLCTIGGSAILTYNFTGPVGLTFVAICEVLMYSLQTLGFISKVMAR
jgi:hypothetical protein